MKSPLEFTLEKKLLKQLTGRSSQAVLYMIEDPEIKYLQDYANTVSIKRLNYNDHGPVHMKKVAINALKMAEILKNRGIKFNLEAEECGTYEDSLISILTAALLHDIGMSVGRTDHEKSSITLGVPIIDRVMLHVYGDDLERRIIGRSLAVECISGHMGNSKIHSLEAGLLLIADGLDMEKGRARIPLMMETESKVGDIHKYSASAIQKVIIAEGEDNPLNIQVTMSESVGFYQIEEVLFSKINSSPLKPYIELYAGVIGEKPKRYL
ncbi:MAG: HD domain-containing protein [Spirochaetales bacterium]|nr:HD domain-containing protein [Spirochaetales bacterium]